MSEMTREEAIDYLEDMKKGLFLWDMTELIDLCISALSENKGEWINKTPHVDGCPIYTCSECGRSNLWDSPFCPYCGADMRGGKAE